MQFVIASKIHCKVIWPSTLSDVSRAANLHQIYWGIKKHKYRLVIQHFNGLEQQQKVRKSDLCYCDLTDCIICPFFFFPGVAIQATACFPSSAQAVFLSCFASLELWQRFVICSVRVGADFSLASTNASKNRRAKKKKSVQGSVCFLRASWLAGCDSAQTSFTRRL